VKKTVPFRLEKRVLNAETLVFSFSYRTTEDNPAAAKKQQFFYKIGFTVDQSHKLGYITALNRK